MTSCGRVFSAVLLLAALLFTGCPKNTVSKKYNQIPPMLNILTNKAQSALEEGALNGDEKAAREYIMKRNPDVLKWFDKNDYEVRMRGVDGYAVVLVCDKGRPVFEDTYCNPGKPDKDYRNDNTLKACEFTIASDDIKGLCKRLPAFP